MRKLLVVTETFDFGGLETHIAGEIVWLSTLDCEVHLVVGEQFRSDLLPTGKLASLSSDFALGPSATSTQLSCSVERLRDLIRRNAIECIHAHPYASLIPCLIAAELERVPLVLTLHGPASVSGVHGPIYEFLLKSVILPNAGLVVAVSEEVARLASAHVRPSNLAVLPNGVDVHRVVAEAEGGLPADPRWLVVSRLDDLKVPGIADFVRKAKSAGIPGILLAGDGPTRVKLQESLDERGEGGFVEFVGFSTDVPRLMRSAAGVAGMGRVVLEGVANRKPVCLVGYDGVKGLVDQGLFRSAAAANFSGRNLGTIDELTFRRQMVQLESIDLADLERLLREQFSEENVWTTFLARASDIAPSGSTILGDAYLSLVSDPICEGRPFLDCGMFFERLRAMSYSVKHFDPRQVGSAEYWKEAIDKQDLRHRVVELEGEIAALRRIHAESEADVAGLRVIHADREAEIADLRRIQGEREAEIADLRRIQGERDAEIAELRFVQENRTGEIAELQRRQQVCEGEVCHLRATVTSLEQQIQTITASRSWRLTSPLRAVKARLAASIRRPGDIGGAKK